MTQEIINIWKGQRKLLPTQNNTQDCVLHCLNGWGYIRVTSEPKRQLFHTGNEIRVSACEIVTISCIQEMAIEMKLITRQQE